MKKDEHQAWMKRALDLATANARKGGGPFGAIIVKDGTVVAEGVNQVTATNDPTAHAEVQAIRHAAQKLGTYDLSGCIIYSSCEPCPMCLGAIYWARLDALYFGAGKDNAAAAGFDDAFIYREIEKPAAQRQLKTRQIDDSSLLEPFEEWLRNPDKKTY